MYRSTSIYKEDFKEAVWVEMCEQLGADSDELCLEVILAKVPVCIGSVVDYEVDTKYKTICIMDEENIVLLESSNRPTEHEIVTRIEKDSKIDPSKLIKVRVTSNTELVRI